MAARSWRSILALDVPRATAVEKITHSAFEEYGWNSTHLRDRLLLAAVRLLAGWPKMPGERECYARFAREWIGN